MEYTAGLCPLVTPFVIIKIYILKQKLLNKKENN
jgi:hypothetical protein